MSHHVAGDLLHIAAGTGGPQGWVGGAAGQVVGCSPHSGANSSCAPMLLRGAFRRARRCVPVISLAASWCPPALITLPLPSVCLSPLHPVHPHPLTHSVNGVICRSFHPLPGCPQPRTPIHFTHDLVLSYFGKCRVPPWPRGHPFTLRSTHGCSFRWPRSPPRCHRSLELSLNGIDSSGTAWRWFPLGWRETRSLS